MLGKLLGPGQTPGRAARGSPGGVGSWERHRVISPEHTKESTACVQKGLSPAFFLVALADAELSLNGDSFSLSSLSFWCMCMQDLGYLSREILSNQWNSLTLTV